ncbi:MAG TPA: cytochrome c [Chitinophagaceae bacterium]|nr:cytochrome c [Chitinophagaceae bacterium]
MALLFTSVCLPALADPIDEGKTIFSIRCAGCHNVNVKLTGPALAGVDQRHSIDWIIGFVKNSKKMINSGDKEAVTIYEQFRIPMPEHPDLTDENIKQIVEYIKSEAKPVEENKGTFAKPSRKPNPSKPLSLKKDIGFFTAYLLSVVLLIAVLLWGVHVKSLQQQRMQVDES